MESLQLHEPNGLAKADQKKQIEMQRRAGWHGKFEWKTFKKLSRSSQAYNLATLSWEVHRKKMQEVRIPKWEVQSKKLLPKSWPVGAGGDFGLVPLVQSLWFSPFWSSLF